MQSLFQLFRFSFTAVAFVGLQNASALTFREREFTCPIDGEKFRTSLAASGTSYGRFLDLKPFGPTAAPWPLAKCPSTGFVLYKETFSEGEIARLREYVGSDEYKGLKSDHSSYYLAAKLRTHLGEKPNQLAYMLLQATWEAKSGEQYRQYAAAALEAYKLALAEPYADQQRWISDQLVAGELERRLEQFDSSKSRFVSLAERDELKTGVLRDIVELQLQLIEAKDSSSKMIPQRSAEKK